MTKILVVEDEVGFRDPLVYQLKKEGYEVCEAADGEEALSQFKAENPDLILLDLMLPKINGNDVCQMIRKTSNVRIIMHSAKESPFDKVRGLEIGADDYVTKGTETAELFARIRAVLRRGVDPQVEVGNVLEAGGVHMDIERHEVEVNGMRVQMPLKEFELLELLLENVNRVLTRGQIIDRVWGTDYFGDTKTLDVHIKRIRSKIEDDPSRPKHLVTVRGLGYKFEA
jgi:two-component system response regulator RegX3